MPTKEYFFLENNAKADELSALSITRQLKTFSRVGHSGSDQLYISSKITRLIQEKAKNFLGCLQET